MSQVRSGAASSLVGGRNTNVIVGEATDWSGVSSGAMFMFTGDNVSYWVASTVHPDVSTSGEWELVLSSPYAGTQKTSAFYAIHNDFEPNNRLPLLRAGDVETATIYSRAMQIIGELLTVGLIFEGEHDPTDTIPAYDPYPIDTTDDVSAYTAKRSYWYIDTAGNGWAVAGRIVWNGGVAGTDADWDYVPPSATYIPAGTITTAMLGDDQVTTAKVSPTIESELEVGSSHHYKGEFSPSGGAYPSTAGLIDKDYYVANDNGIVSSVSYLKGDWARYDQDTGDFNREAQYAPFGSPFTFNGNWDASGNSAPSNPLEYDAWRISVAGTFGGTSWVAGDVACYINSGWSLYPKPADITLYNTTTNATQTELFLDGSSSRLTIATDRTWGYDILVTARRTDADNESAFYRFEGAIDNNAGTVASVGQVAATPIEDTVAWACVVEPDNTNDALVIKVTGEASKTIYWVASVRLVETAG